jgi:DNA-binding transcriptional LysR family regulator
VCIFTIIKNTVSILTIIGKDMLGASELAIFAAVVEESSFSKAAVKTGLSKTVVSKKISALEQELKTQLIYRTTRKLSLTEAGQVLYKHAEGINRQTQSAFESINELSNGVSGHVRMSVPTISGELLLADLISNFCKRHPEISVEMRLENKLVDLVEDGIDLAIRTAILEDSSLIATKLIQSSWVVCASKEYLNNATAINSLDDLNDHNCLLYDLQAEGSNEWRFTKDNQSFSINVSGNMSSNNALTLKKAALNNCGIIYVPKCCIYEELLANKLVPVLTKYKPRVLGVYAVYPYTRHQPKRIKLLIEQIRNEYQNLSHYFE